MFRRHSLCFALIFLLPVVSTLGVANPSKPEASSPQIELKLTPEKSVIHPDDTLSLRVEIWNVGTEDTFVAQNIENIYFNAVLTLYLETKSGWQGSNQVGAADAIPEAHPDLAKTFVINWLTLRKHYYYGTVIYMDPRNYPPLEKPGHYRVKAQYTSRGISPAFAYNAARLNQEDIEKLPFKAWEGTVDSNVVSIQVRSPMKRSSATLPQ